jgi:hypothetical protein
MKTSKKALSMDTLKREMTVVESEMEHDANNLDLQLRKLELQGKILKLTIAEKKQEKKQKTNLPRKQAIQIIFRLNKFLCRKYIETDVYKALETMGVNLYDFERTINQARDTILENRAARAANKVVV